MLSIATYAMISLALFKFIPVTLTLAGIAGVLLSTGGALDANILIFERLKEELRSGKNLQNALGFVLAKSLAFHSGLKSGNIDYQRNSVLVRFRVWSHNC